LVVAGVWLYRRNGAGERQRRALLGSGGAGERQRRALLGSWGAGERQRRALLGSGGEELPEEREALMDAIIALDDMYQAGELPEEAYRERRAELKEKLSGYE
jgi:hypothetical protein